MRMSAVVTLLICLAALAGCAYSETPEERERQDRAEEQRRIDAMNRGR